MADRALKVDVALVHYPVVNRVGETIGSAVTNLDLHDIARAGCTYGVSTYWVVTPDMQQQELAEKIVAHWTQGYGGLLNPDRKDALSLIRICTDLGDVVRRMTEKWGMKPLIIATCARPEQSTIEYAAIRNVIARERPLLLIFGTAWGLAPEMIAEADETLPPLRGSGEYNHLSVRSAVSIILDRLLARD